MFNTLKNKLHAILFPAMALQMLQLQDEIQPSNDLLLQMDEALGDRRDQKIQAQLAVGHARTELQEQRFLNDIQKSIIAALNKTAATRHADAGKWKGAALELVEELKNSFFEIAELNKKLERGEIHDKDGAKTMPQTPELRLVA